MRMGFREVVFLIVLLVVPVASYIYVFKPRNAEITLAQKEVEQKRERLAKLQEVSARIDDIGVAIEQGRQAVELIEAKLPSQQDVEVILEDVWQLARQARLTVKSVKSQKPVPAALYMEQPLVVIMEGEFSGFFEFLQKLEKLPRITRIHQLRLKRFTSLTRRRDGPETGMQAAFTLSIYFQPRSRKPDEQMG